MRVLKLTIAYEGTAFDGYQLQAAGRTVQGEMERALQTLCGQPLRPTAAGRTDAGVHAAGQVLSLRLPEAITLPPKGFVHGLNRLLPEDVAVLEARDMPEGFDARRHARRKHYRYRLINRRTRHPLLRRTHWLFFPPLAVAPMQAAAVHLQGEHDFAAFRASDCVAKTTVRRLHRVSLEAHPGGELVLDVEGTAFLKHMVRNLMGTLVHVGRARLAASDMPRLLASRDRTLAGPTAPPHGLTLLRVDYEDAHGQA